MPRTHTRTRFAPSPTGDPHIGSLWTALFNWLYARQHDGQFVLRIEDTDRKRYVPGAEERIIETVRWYGLNYDEGPDIGGPFGPYRSSERLPLYRAATDELLDRGAAYLCFCSAERLETLRREQQARRQPPGYDGHCRQLPLPEAVARRAAGTPYVVRLKFPKIGETTFTDLIRGTITFQNKLIDDQVLMKSDGWPTYHLAAIVDDHAMEIGPVIRAEEWLSSTPKHIFLYGAFGWSPPQFAHLPLILSADRSKLSKRHGSADALAFKRAGYLPDALVNYLALLGWNPKTSQEFFSRSELIQEFDLENCNRAGAAFDERKLLWVNAQHIRRMSTRSFIEMAEAYLTDECGYIYDATRGSYTTGEASIPKEELARGLAALQTRVNRLADLAAALAAFFLPPTYDAKLLIWKKLSVDTDPATVTRQRLEWLLDRIETIVPDERIEEEALEVGIKEALKHDVIPLGEVLWPMRVALSGLPESPGPFTIASVIGKTETVQRLRTATHKLNPR